MTPTITYYPLNYTFNQGTWFIYDPTTGNVGDGAFMPNRAFGPKDFTDGLANTLAAAEVKAYQPNVWDTTKPNTVGVVPPATPDELQAADNWSDGGALPSPVPVAFRQIDRSAAMVPMAFRCFRDVIEPLLPG